MLKKGVKALQFSKKKTSPLEKRGSVKKRKRTWALNEQ